MFDDGWTMRRLADGVGLFPPGGIRDGSVRIRDRKRPLRPARVLRERAVTAIGDVRALGPIERLYTDEGELAVITTTQLKVGEHTLGIIFGDDFYTQIDVFTADPESFARFRDLARDLLTRYAIGLGRIRMRRPFYDPPRDWIGYPRGLTTLWYPPGFPANPTAITVFPAMPVGHPAGSISELFNLGSKGASASGTSAVRVGDLQGDLTEVVSEASTCTQVRLADAHFVYGLQLDCPNESRDESREVFAHVIESLEPIPRPRQQPASDAFSCWAL